MACDIRIVSAAVSTAIEQLCSVACWLVQTAARRHPAFAGRQLLGRADCTADDVVWRADDVVVGGMVAAAQLALDINQVRATGGVTVRLDRLWKPISRVAPFDRGWLGLLDSGRRHFFTAAAVGHDIAAQQYLESGDFYDEVQATGLLHRRGPVDVQSGIALPLTARDERRLGLLTLHPDGRPEWGDLARAALEQVAPVLADMVDPMTTIAGLAVLAPGAWAAAVVDGDGRTGPVPGLPAHPALRDRSALVRVAQAALLNRRTPAVFLSPEGADKYLQITAVATPRQPPRSLAALVLVSRPDDLYRLTRRELEVLGFLIEGSSNPHIAAELFITERTVAAHLEHIRAKLNAGTRTVAAVEALRQGLYIPPELAGLTEGTAWWSHGRPAGSNAARSLLP